VSFEFEPHTFVPRYAVEAQPEFPADGVWIEPLYCYDRDGRVVAEPETRWGAPFVLRVTPDGGDAWVGIFAAGGLGGEAGTGAHACPRPDQLCVLVDGLAYLVSADAPGDGATALDLSITQIVATAEPPSLLLVTYSSVTALGPSGIAWQSGRIGLDGLRIERVSSSRIDLRIDNLEGGYDDLSLDPATGNQIAGRRFKDSWPPDALA
jgi:hypothetical protein